MNTSTPVGEQNRVADIAPDGDVVLIVGEENVRLRVYSQCLRSASKVLGAMLKQNFKEGHTLATQSSTEVTLPEDGAEAMRTICYVIHLRNDLLSEHLTAREVLQIAVLANKYDLSTALEHVSFRWLKSETYGTLLDRGDLVTAAFLLKNNDAFMAHTKALLLSQSESYLVLHKNEIIKQFLPLEMFYLLEEQRTAMRMQIYKALMPGMMRVCGCGWGKARAETFRKLLVAALSIEIFEVPLSDVITRLLKPAYPDDTGVRVYCSYFGNYHDPEKYSETIPAMLKTLKENAGFSIDFVRSLGAAEIREEESIA